MLDIPQARIEPAVKSHDQPGESHTGRNDDPRFRRHVHGSLQLRFSHMADASGTSFMYFGH